MAHYSHQLKIPTRGKGLYLCTREIEQWLQSIPNIDTGLLTIFIQHTSASLVIQENADPDVVLDLADFFEKLVPEEHPRHAHSLYRHTVEGTDDMPAHIRTALTQTHLSIPVINGQLALGTWQGIYVFEHRSAAQHRSLVLHLMGE